MPIYEYQCLACDERVEKLQKLSDPPLTACPACGEEELKKLVSAAAFRLKGGGWYETDFKKEGKRNLAGDDKPADKSPETKPAESKGADSKASGPNKAAKPAGEAKSQAAPAS